MDMAIERYSHKTEVNYLHTLLQFIISRQLKSNAKSKPINILAKYLRPKFIRYKILYLIKYIAVHENINAI